MKITCVGGGPGGLYFALLIKKARPDADVTVYERNRSGDTFGFGVVFSDATLERLANADAPSYEQITRAFAHWDDIDIHFGGEVLRSTGHGFSGLSRKALLAILERRALEVGVRIVFEKEVPADEAFAGSDLVLVADGVNSAIRARYAERFEPSITMRPNRFVWLGTTFPFDAFTFYFEPAEAGLLQVHAYRYDAEHSTFIVECSDETFRRTGLDPNDERATVAYCERVFAHRLNGHRLLENRSIWRNFPVIECRRWHDGRMVLLGDAAHTAHFSIGSGTKLALEDAVALCDALLAERTIPAALEAYERDRRPIVEALQRSAQVSLEWFESTERYLDLDPLTFAFSCLTRSLRVTHPNLAKRDPAFVRRVDEAFAERAERHARAPVRRAKDGSPPPPMFTPLRLRDLVIPNRVVLSPMCMYSARDGTVDDFHLVHLGSRAIGGAGLVMTEMTDVSAEARITHGCAGMYSSQHVTAWRRIVDFVHAQSPAKIGIQLAHAGRKASTRFMWEGIDEPLRPDEGAWPIVAASPLPYLPHSPVPRELDRAGMDAIVADFARAASLAEEAGFDLVELHMAHGYLLASFLSPLTNVRKDAYGGSLANRMRFPLEVFDAVRAQWPAHKPMSVRVSATDWAPGGIEPGESVEIARTLAAHGCDVIDVSTGQTIADAKPRYGRLYQTPFSDRIRQEAKIVTMTVGNVSSWGDVNSILAAGRADLCLLARGHLYDPYWTRHAAYEQGWDLEWPKQYRPAKTFTPR